MKIHHILAVSALMALPLPSNAVNKCVDSNGKVSYQDKPCPRESTASKLKIKGVQDSKVTSRRKLSASTVAFEDVQLTSGSIKMLSKPPKQGTPEFAAVEQLIAREAGDSAKVLHYASKETPDWLKKSMSASASKEHGPLRKETVAYEVREKKDEKVLVSVTCNFKDGTHQSSTQWWIIEDGRWVREP